MGSCVCTRIRVEARGQLPGVRFLLPLHRFGGLESGSVVLDMLRKEGQGMITGHPRGFCGCSQVGPRPFIPGSEPQVLHGWSGPLHSGSFRATQWNSPLECFRPSKFGADGLSR